MSLSTIDCIFYTDTSLPKFLAESSDRDLVGDLLVEVSGSPTLAYALNLETPNNYPGIAGILGELSLDDLAMRSDALPVPIVLAAGTPPSALALRSAIAALRGRHANFSRITMLVPIDAVAPVASALAVADRFSIAWDTTDFPSAQLLPFVQDLAEEGLLDRENFGGLHAYSPDLLDATAATHVDQINSLLANASKSLPAINTEVFVPSA